MACTFLKRDSRHRKRGFSSQVALLKGLVGKGTPQKGDLREFLSCQTKIKNKKVQSAGVYLGFPFFSLGSPFASPFAVPSTNAGTA